MSDYIDEDLPARQRRRLERHTDICPECRRLLRTLIAVVRALRALRDDRDGAIASSVIARTQRETIGRVSRQGKS